MILKLKVKAFIIFAPGILGLLVFFMELSLYATASILPQKYACTESDSNLWDNPKTISLYPNFQHPQQQIHSE